MRYIHCTNYTVYTIHTTFTYYIHTYKCLYNKLFLTHHIHARTLFLCFSIHKIGTFKKMILFSPCIKPYFPSYLEYSIIAAHYAGFGLTLATKFDTDISKDKLSHNIQQIAFWSSLRHFFPDNLIVTGPTFQWLYELLVASAYVHKVSG